MMNALTIEQRAWRIVHEQIPKWWNNYTREYPRSKVSERDLRDQAAHACVVATLEAVGVIPPDVLSWVSAHPEDAKRLAEGTMVATTPEQITNLCFSAFMNSFEPNKEDGGKSDWVNDTAPLVKRWIERLAASTPVPSDEAQGETT